MAIKKSDLYSSLWSGCDELRGGMDASQYKDYVLVPLFVKYVSDKYAGKPYAPITIPTGAGFADLVALKGKPDIGDQINKKILGPLAQANHLSDMPDFNDPNKLGSGKEMVDRLTNLIAIFENPALDFSKNRAEGDDLLGDAYEYLMRHFATESGKSKGQFYTPSEVSRVIARYYAQEQAAIATLEAQLAALAQQMEEMAEENGGEEGLLADATNDRGKITKASVASRLKELKSAPSVASVPLVPSEDADERQALQAYLALTEQEADTGAQLKTAQDALTAQVAARYGQLTEAEIQTLVVDDKWHQELAAAVQGELDRVSQTLTGRIRQLAERYATPLPELTTQVESLAAKVAGHLNKMGVQP